MSCPFYCQECGHGFRTVAAAERAMNGDRGCPRCGGSDVDIDRPKSEAERQAEARSIQLRPFYSVPPDAGSES